jgi:hypothetical protein
MQASDDRGISFHHAKKARSGRSAMLFHWEFIPEDIQLRLAHDALLRAVEMIVGQAETLAQGIEVGSLPERGGAEALRLLAAVARADRHAVVFRPEELN